MEGKIIMPQSKGLLSKFFSSIFSRSNHNSQRVSIFIDGSNLYHSLEENCKRFDLDFYAFAQKLCASRKLTRIYYYNVQRDPDRGTTFLRRSSSVPFSPSARPSCCVSSVMYSDSSFGTSPSTSPFVSKDDESDSEEEEEDDDDKSF